MSCPVSSSCDYQKPLETLRREAFAKNSDGCLGIRATVSESSGSDCEQLTCAEQALSLDELTALTYTTNADGCTVKNIVITS
jgi:hypothetical protein